MRSHGVVCPEGHYAAGVAKLSVLARGLALGAIRLYQIAISPVFGRHCRFHPTCSEYARQAIELHGVRRGGGLAVRRILRCHPFNSGGYDPVPATVRLRASSQ